MPGRARLADPLDVLEPDERKLLRRADAKFVPPMLATLTHDTFSDPDWIYERKLDGVRLIVVRRNGKVSLFTRNRNVADGHYPEVKEAFERLALPAGDLVVDGEVVALVDGQTSFARLQQRMGKSDPRLSRSSGVPIHFYLFDVLNLDGNDLTALPLRSRKRVLEAFRLQEPLRPTECREQEGEAFLEEACALGWEGLIAKRADARYQNKRSRDWLKFKCSAGQEFVIGGYTEPQGTRLGFGALLVGYHENGGLRYAGKVGTGFGGALLVRLHKALRAMEAQGSPFVDDIKDAGVHWVTPKLVCEVEFTEWTPDGRLRHPRFKGLRDDKRPAQVTREK